MLIVSNNETHESRTTRLRYSKQVTFEVRTATLQQLFSIVVAKTVSEKTNTFALANRIITDGHF